MSSASSSFDAPKCTICLENVIEGNNRSIAKLQCGHIFHLDCIGSEFNFHCVMRCPNCRETENGQWLYAAGGYNQHVSEVATELVGDGEHYHILLPTGREWCPLLNRFRDSPEHIRERLLIHLGFFHVVRVEPHRHLTEQTVVGPIILTPWGPTLTSSLGSSSSPDSDYEANRFWHQQTSPNSLSPMVQSLASGVRPLNSGVAMEPEEMPYLAQLASGFPGSPTHNEPGEAGQAQNTRGQASREAEMLTDDYNRNYSMRRLL